jgi:hypothetical protein
MAIQTKPFVSLASYESDECDQDFMTKEIPSDSPLFQLYSEVILLIRRTSGSLLCQNKNCEFSKDLTPGVQLSYFPVFLVDRSGGIAEPDANTEKVLQTFRKRVTLCLPCAGELIAASGKADEMNAIIDEFERETKRGSK